MLRRPALVFLALLCAGTGRAQASVRSGPELPSVLRGLAERTQQYYDRFISIICTRTVRSQDLKSNLQPAGRPRITVFELSVSRNSEPRNEDDFRIGRTLLSVDGRPARKNQEPECTDPKTGSPEPLGFLLGKNQQRYRFSLDGQAVGGPDGARALSFVQSPPDRVDVQWRNNCFAAQGGGQEGRVWFDPETFDVLQMDVRLSKPFRVPLPSGLSGMQAAIRVERWEMVVHFSRVAFENPLEVVLLPDSIDTLAVMRGVPSLRTTQQLTNFRRFLSESTIRTVAF